MIWDKLDILWKCEGLFICGDFLLWEPVIFFTIILQYYTKEINKPKQPKKAMSKPQKQISSTRLTSPNSRSKIRSKTSESIYTETYYSQPKVQNKKLKYIRPSTKSSFFNHLHSTKIIESEQLLDESFVKFLDNLQNHKGFRGTKTHSWNQLLYLTPQKRHKTQGQQLKHVQHQLYEIIKPEKIKESQKTPMRTTLIEFLTEYNPKINPTPDRDKTLPIRCQRKGSNNVIREKLRNYHRKSQYKNVISRLQDPMIANPSPQQFI